METPLKGVCVSVSDYVCDIRQVTERKDAQQVNNQTHTHTDTLELDVTAEAAETFPCSSVCLASGSFLSLTSDGSRWRRSEHTLRFIRLVLCRTLADQSVSGIELICRCYIIYIIK